MYPVMNKGDIHLRLAQREDVEELLRLLPQLTNNPKSVSASTPGIEEALKIFDRIQEHGNIFIIVATEAEGQIVGALTIVVVPNLTYNGRPWAVIENVVVDRNYRGQGIGSLMMKQAFQMAQEFGCYKVQVVSGAKDEQIQFYRQVGMDDQKCHGYKKYLLEK